MPAVKEYTERIRDDVVIPMKEYKKECGRECGYSFFDILTCKRALMRFVKRLSCLKEKSDEAILGEVEKVVVSLNRLNKKTNYSLIETDAREEIWSIIQDLAVESGLSETDGDVTEEWREW